MPSRHPFDVRIYKAAVRFATKQDAFCKLPSRSPSVTRRICAGSYILNCKTQPSTSAPFAKFTRDRRRRGRIQPECRSKGSVYCIDWKGWQNSRSARTRSLNVRYHTTQNHTFRAFSNPKLEEDVLASILPAEKVSRLGLIPLWLAVRVDRDRRANQGQGACC